MVSQFGCTYIRIRKAIYEVKMGKVLDNFMWNLFAVAKLNYPFPENWENVWDYILNI